mgnify:CR=1 FL=1
MIISDFQENVQQFGGINLRECYISFDSAAQIRDFVSLATRQPCPVRVQRDGFDTIATSIMSLFGMGLHTILCVVAPNVPEMADFFTQLSAYAS